jgi:hypothetical protein
MQALPLALAQVLRPVQAPEEACDDIIAEIEVSQRWTLQPYFLHSSCTLNHLLGEESASFDNELFLTNDMAHDIKLN